MQNTDYRKKLQEHAQLQRSQKGQLCQSLPTRDSLLKKHDDFKRYIANLPSQTFVVQAAEVSASRRPISDLKEMTFDELRLQTVHRGRFLIAKVIAEPFKLDCIMTVLQDRNGDAAKLCVYNFVSTYCKQNLQDYLPNEAVVILKEPFFKLLMDNTPAIRCDHPSDLIVVGTPEYTFEGALAKLSNWPVGSRAEIADVDELKARADALYKEKRFHEAVAMYSSALDRDPGKRALFLNRAAAYMQLDAYLQAQADVLAVLTAEPTDEKALLRAAKCAYHLRKFADADTHLKELLSHHETNKEGAELAKLVEERLRESRGQFDWKALFVKALKAGGHGSLDCADFVGPVKTVQVPGKGRGLQAKKNIKPGSLVMCVKAVEVAFASECSNVSTLHQDFLNSPASSRLAEKLCAALSRDAQVRQRVYTLFAGYKAPQTSDLVSDEDSHSHDPFSFDQNVVDTQRISRICFFNEIAIDRPAQVVSDSGEQQNEAAMTNEYGSGLWLEPALINHSCLPNCNRVFLGDMMVVRAVKSIKKGEELTFSYLPFHESAALRKQLFDKHQFTCKCALCDADRNEASDELARRQALFASFLSDIVPYVADLGADPQELTEQLTKLVDDMRESYRKSQRNECFELISLLFALAHLHQRTNRIEKSIAYLTQLVQVAIPELKTGEVNSLDDMNYSAVVLQATVQLAALCLQIGEMNDARFWQQLALQLHKYDIADDADLFRMRFDSVLPHELF